MSLEKHLPSGIERLSICLKIHGVIHIGMGEVLAEDVNSSSLDLRTSTNPMQQQSAGPATRHLRSM